IQALAGWMGTVAARSPATTRDFLIILSPWLLLRGLGIWTPERHVRRLLGTRRGEVVRRHSRVELPVREVGLVPLVARLLRERGADHARKMIARADPDLGLHGVAGDRHHVRQ